MSADIIYTMAQAVRASGVSEASIRNYTSGRFSSFYLDFFSPGARPGTGQPRIFSDNDLKLLRYIHQRTRQGATHETIKGEIAGGALEDFEPPDVTARQAQEGRRRAPAAEGGEEPPAALVAVQEVARQLAAVMVNQLDAERAANDELRSQVLEAEKRAAAAERETELLRVQLEELRAARQRSILSRLFNRG